jgi:hypothetical protein
LSTAALFAALDLSGKSGAHRHHRENRTARAAKNRRRALLFPKRKSQMSVAICRTSLVTTSLNLACWANHWHSGIIERLPSPRGNPSRAFSFFRRARLPIHRLTVFPFCSSVRFDLFGVSAAMPKHKLRMIALTAVTALALFDGHAPAARGEPAFCLSRVKAYVRELDPILAEAKYSLTPIHELNDRYFPFVDCDPGALIEAATHSRFFLQALYDKQAEDYDIEFSNGEVVVSFLYRRNERTSFLPTAGWVKKP